MSAIHLPDEDAEPEQLYAYALSVLEETSALRHAVQSEADLRSDAVNAMGKGWRYGIPMNLVSNVGGMLARVRLARWALVLHEERAAGRPLAGDLTVYADRFPDGPPLDPSTGEPFRWVAVEGAHLLSVDAERARSLDLFIMGFLDDWPEDMRTEHLIEHDLAWLIPD